MTWTAPAPDPVDGPLAGADRPILEGFPAWQRTTLLNIRAGPSGEQLAARPLATSELSLLGLIRHRPRWNASGFVSVRQASGSNRSTTLHAARRPGTSRLRTTARRVALRGRGGRWNVL
jgi:hypothetical protein